MNHPVVLSANRVQTKKKPPELLTTPPLEWMMIMPAPISPPRSMMMYPQIRSESTLHVAHGQNNVIKHTDSLFR